MSSVIVTWHVPTPVQPPPVHPSNVFCSPGTAVSVTTVPTANVALHWPTGLYLAVVQLIPEGLDVTVPVASMKPNRLKVTVCVCADPAVTVRTATATTNRADTLPLAHLTPEHTRTSVIEGHADTPEPERPT